MQFALSIVAPPEGSAGYGKAEIVGPVAGTGELFRPIYWAIRKRGAHVHPEVANKIAEEATGVSVGAEVTEEGTGLRFRVHEVTEDDPAPHPCPCCGRLVSPDDHAYAGDEDAYCLGCFTWDRNTPAGLPENTAHAAREESCG